MAEVYRHLSSAPVFSSSHMKINMLEVQTERTLSFADIAALAQFGVTAEAFRRGEDSRTQEIGAAARFLDLDGLIVPSARSQSSNLVLFLDRMDHRETMRVVRIRDVNWPAWRETRRN